MIRNRTPLLALLLAASIAVPAAAQAQPAGGQFEAIVVRGDIYADWTVAVAYGLHRDIPVITLIPGINDDEVVSMVLGLTSFDETPRVMVVGDRRAVPEDFVIRLESQGVAVSRFGGPTRFDTAIYVTTQLWGDADTLIVVDGTRPELYFPALLWSRQYSAPIVYSSEGHLPDSFWASAGTYLPNLERVILIGDPLSADELSRLSSSYQVIRVSPTEAPTEWPRRGRLSAVASVLLTPGTAVGAALGAVVAYLLVSRARGRETPLDLLEGFLTADERAIFSAVVERGQITQDRLPELTGFSKPKVSRLVAELIDRGLIERERRGKTYVLYPAKIFKAGEWSPRVGEG
ncbi:MAG: helix-turn-helix domain-containing protein [Candidatus Korarchaeota archaeon]|nr:helix-turn-helix domain-containing protein [Candidatus Korarchaeota archaeon]